MTQSCQQVSTICSPNQQLYIITFHVEEELSVYMYKNGVHVNNKTSSFLSNCFNESLN